MFFKMYRFYVFFAFVITSSCVTDRKSEYTTQGHLLPGRQLMDVENNQYICEPLINNGIKDIEQLMNEYGRKGWKFTTMIYKKGNPVGFCVEK